MRVDDLSMGPERIRFGSFSLGDVMEHEIRKLGRFAFRDKRSNGNASKNFVEKFLKSAPPLGRTEDGRKAWEFCSEREKSQGNLSEKFSQEAHTNSPGPTEPTHPFGTCIDDLYSHSWSDRVGVWLWVPRNKALVAADLKLGFPARESEIRKFGSSARRIIKTTPRKVDGRSFAAVAKMDRGWDSGNFKGRGYAPRPGRGSGRFGGSQGPNIRPEQFERDESYGRGRPYSGEGGESFRGYGGGLTPLAQSTTSATLMIERGWKRRNKT
jgi:hypothetical protein